MTDYHLVPHPDFPSHAIEAIRVTVDRRDGLLEFWFWLSGDLDRLRITGHDCDELRTEGLWEHTCFEAFVRLNDKTAYSEFNWSPGGGWAAYTFDDRRIGKRNLGATDGEQIVSCGYHSGFDGGFQWSFIVADLFGERFNASIGLTAVIEAKDGTKSYWALAHAPGPPDFHNPDSFIATLPAPDRA